MKKIFLSIITVLAIVLFSIAFSACSHVHKYTKNVVNVTCTSDGYTLYKCACGDEYKENITLALGHEFTNYVSNNDATTSQDGTETAKCNRDGCNQTHTRIDEGSKLNYVIEFVENGVCDYQIVVPEDYLAIMHKGHIKNGVIFSNYTIFLFY